MWKIIGHQQLLAFFEQVRHHGRLSHAYLFFGPAQVGKRTLALAFAQALLCHAGNLSPDGGPCWSCAACLKVEQHTHPDLSTIWPQDGKKTVGIGEIQELQRAAALQPQEGGHRIFLLPNAEFLTLEAANALLKTLEEPSASTLLLLTTTNRQVLPATIVSRCQLVPVGLVGLGDIRRALMAEWAQEEARAHLLADLSAGRPGWAIRACHDAALPEQRAAWLEAMGSLCASAPTQRMLLASKLSHEVDQPEALLEVWLLWWREVLLSVEGYTFDKTRVTPAPRYADQTDFVAARAAIGFLQAAQEHLEQNAPPRLVLETLALELPFLAP